MENNDKEKTTLKTKSSSLFDLYPTNDYTIQAPVSAKTELGLLDLSLTGINSNREKNQNDKFYLPKLEKKIKHGSFKSQTSYLPSSLRVFNFWEGNNIFFYKGRILLANKKDKKTVYRTIAFFILSFASFILFPSKFVLFELSKTLFYLNIYFFLLTFFFYFLTMT